MSSIIMSRSTKWKLAIVAGISECLVCAEAKKFCAFEMHGEPKYYVCPRSEYCCSFGCCVSPGFQIYHLWYYWLLVIIMFLVCSGGGWWYRYWLQGRYRAAASTIPTRSSNSRSHNPLRGPTCQAQQARISYNAARNTVLLHRMWKGPHRNTTSPAYSGAGAASSAAHYQNTSVVLNDANCPYYQLYGPPPSYETVIAQTARGKISSPSSPELLRTTSAHHQRSVVPLPPPLPPDINFPSVGQCYYNIPPAARLPPPDLEVPQYQPTANPNFDTAEYVRLVQQTYGQVPTDTGASMIVSPRHQLHQQQQQFTQGIRRIYDRFSTVNTGKSSDNSDDADNTITNASQPNSPDEGGFPISRIDCINRSTCPSDNEQLRLKCHASAGKLTSRIGVHGPSRRDRTKFDSASSSQSELAGSEPIATTSSSLGFDVFSYSTTQRTPSRSELRKIQGGSLKIHRRRDQHQLRQQDTLRINRRLSSTDCEVASSSRGLTAMPFINRENHNSQSSPSNNVILAANAISKNTLESGVQDQPIDCHNRHNQQQQQQQLQQQQQQQQHRHPAPSIAERSSTNSNLESKRKLDRSRSLD